MKKVTLAVAAAFALSTAAPAFAGSYVAPVEDDDVIIPVVAPSSIGGGALAAAAVLAVLAIAAAGDS